MVRPMVAVLAFAALITIVALVWLWPTGDVKQDQNPGEKRTTGTITAISKTKCPEYPGSDEAPPGMSGPNGCGTASVTLSSKDNRKRIKTELPTGPGAPKVKKGDEVVLIYTSDVSGEHFQIIDHQRGNQLWILGIAFAVAVIAFGRLRGLSALVGLIFTFGVLLLFVVPAILAGESPLLTAIVGSAAIMLVVLYLTHGFNVSTSIALIGTLSSLALTGLMAALAASAAHLTGIAEESSMYLGMMHGVDMRGLLLAGIIIGSLGVLDDVTVTQAATVSELAHANPAYRFRQLYQASTRVGRAHIASVINTIVLAYAGASLPLLLLIAAGDQPLGEVLTNQLIAQELIRSIVSTLGLIAAVPITTALAAMAATRFRATGAVPGEQQNIEEEPHVPMAAAPTERIAMPAPVRAPRPRPEAKEKPLFRYE
ncbi:MAG: YibE/F family protein [Corynebacteriales bacterium]|nr:YibE/F family protein [Mycobacteriales bacterium]